MLEFNYLSWWVGGGRVGKKKNKINAILNSVKVKVEVDVKDKVGKILYFQYQLNASNKSKHMRIICALFPISPPFL